MNETFDIGEIDTSAPIESVKEAVTMFGGLGFYKPLPISRPSLSTIDVEEVDVANVEEEAAKLEKELILKEKETLMVLKELDSTKLNIEELRSKLRLEDASNLSHVKPFLAKEDIDEEKENSPNLSVQNLPESSPAVILMHLKQAKWNLTKTTNDMTEIRASVKLYNKKIEQERTSLDKTRERLRSSTSKISSLEHEISQTKSNASTGGGKDMMMEIQRLNTEAEKYNKMGEAAKSEVMKVISQIEQTKAEIKISEIRLVAARKMKEAAKAAEFVALTEIKALEKSKNLSFGSGILEENTEKITLTLKEYSSLNRKAYGTEQCSDINHQAAMVQIDEANTFKGDIMKRMEETMEEVKTSKQALEDALDRVEASNNAKLAIEEALRKWRSENGEKRQSKQSNAKFKNRYPSSEKRDSLMLDLNGVSLVGEATSPNSKPTLSIGQILSRKLLIAEKFESGKRSGKRKVSLGQILGKQNGELSSARKFEKEGGNPKKMTVKRKKFGFARFSMLLPKQSQKKKLKPNARLNFFVSGCKGRSQEVNQLALQKM